MAAVEVIEVPEFVEPGHDHYLRLVTLDTTPQVLRTGPTLSQRRAARRRMLQRRRRTIIVLLVIAGTALLAVPGHTFGATNNAGLSTDVASSSELAPGMVYVVQPGDTMSSLARMVNPVDPALARGALVRELDSSYVVAGEHVLIP
jgi:hypothetical protein